MDNLDKKLKDLNEIEMPSGLHQSIMRNVNYKKVLPLILIPFMILALNFIVVSWHIDLRLVDAEWKDMLLDLWEGFDFTMDFFTTIVESFLEIIPLPLLILFIFSLSGTIYTGLRFIKANRERSGK
jgi:hypothetical protein